MLRTVTVAHTAAAVHALIAKISREIEADCTSDAALTAALAELDSPPIRSGRRGRPSLQTQARKAAVIALYERVVPQKWIAARVGVSRETLRNWEHAGDQFSWHLTRAKGRGVMRLHLQVLRGGRGSWQAMWLLERLLPADYGRSVSLNHGTRRWNKASSRRSSRGRG